MDTEKTETAGFNGSSVHQTVRMLSILNQKGSTLSKLTQTFKKHQLETSEEYISIMSE